MDVIDCRIQVTFADEELNGLPAPTPPGDPGTGRWQETLARGGVPFAEFREVRPPKATPAPQMLGAQALPDAGPASWEPQVHRSRKRLGSSELGPAWPAGNEELT